MHRRSTSRALLAATVVASLSVALVGCTADDDDPNGAAVTGIIPAPVSFAIDDGGRAVHGSPPTPARGVGEGAAAVAETFAARRAHRHGVRAARRRRRGRGIRHRLRRRRRRVARRGGRGVHARERRRRRAHRGRHPPTGLFRGTQSLRQLLPRRDRASGCRVGTRPTDGPCPRHPWPTRRASPIAARCSTSRATSSPSTTCCGYIDDDRAAEAQRAAPAPHRRPGLAHRDRLVARAHRHRRARRRSAATAAASTRRTTTAASSSTPPSGSSRSCPRSTCPATRTPR